MQEKARVVFQGKLTVSTPGAGARACERVQKMPPLQLEILCVGKDWYVATKGKIQFNVLTFLVRCFHLKWKLHLWSG